MVGDRRQCSHCRGYFLIRVSRWEKFCSQKCASAWDAWETEHLAEVLAAQGQT